jgi:hypothetical protein
MLARCDSIWFEVQWPLTHPGCLPACSLLLPLTRLPSALLSAAEPGIAGVSAQRLSSRWQRLTSLASRHPPWASQLAAQGPASLARCLTAPDESLNRLAFVLRNGIQVCGPWRRQYRTAVYIVSAPAMIRNANDSARLSTS